MNVQKTIVEESVLYQLEGRLNYGTAPILEEEMKDIKNYKKVVFDLNQLEYLSSSGLKLVLRSKKEVDDTSVINCNPEVYQTFEVTGFTDLMTITQKEISKPNPVKKR